MESISELKKIVQKSQVNYKSPWYARKVIRKISVYITWLFLHTSISANQVTVLQLIVSLSGIGLLCFAEVQTVFYGILLLHLGYILDCVDGEVARYRKSQSISGLFLDFVNHCLVIPLIFACLSFHYYFSTNSVYCFCLGLLIILTKMQSIPLAKYLAIDFLVSKRHSPSYDVTRYRLSESQSSNTGQRMQTPQDLEGIIKKTRNFITKLLSHPSDLILATGLVLIELITRDARIGISLLTLFGFFFTAIFLIDVYSNLRKNTAERDFFRYLEAFSEILEKLKKENG